MPSTRRTLPSPTPGLARGLGCLFLFALPFLAGGLWMGGVALSAVVNHVRTAAWVEVPATILESELVSDSGTGSHTQWVRARYRYEYGGQTYEGKRVGLHHGGDSMEEYHRSLFNELDHHRRQGTPYPALVNPGDPSRAVLRRDLRGRLLAFELIFFLAFAGVGSGLLAVGIPIVRRTARHRGLKQAHPGEPWCWREDWAQKRIVHREGPAALGGLAVALVFTVLSAPLALLLPEEVSDGNHLALVGLVFPAVSLFLLVRAVKGILRWRRYPPTILELDEVPARPGSYLRGEIQLPESLGPGLDFEVTLQQQRRARHRRSQKAPKVEWSAPPQRTTRSPGRWGQRTLPVTFEIPRNAASTDPEDPEGAVLWQVEVKTTTRGEDYSAKFDVPVFGPLGK